MNKEQFIREMAAEARAHWENMQDIHEDDDDMPAPENMAESMLIGCFSDSMQRYAELKKEMETEEIAAKAQTKREAYLSAR